MRSEIALFLLAPLLTRCAPLANRAGPILPSSNLSDTTSSTVSAVSSSFNTSITASLTTTTSFVAVEPTLQPEIVINSDGSESVFVAPVPLNDSSSDTSGGDLSAQGVRPLLTGYYPWWSGMPPNLINYSTYDWIDFAFATVDKSQNLTFPDPSCLKILQEVVNEAHAKGKYVKLSVGGWGSSQYFSSAVFTQNSRQTFVNSVRDVIANYSLDGIDFDWEYPGREGLEGNQVDSQDSSNFLSFLQLLRSTLPRNVKITAAVSQTPFAGTNGQPMQDVSAFAKVLDWIMIMNYDVWQSSQTPGSNAPLSDNCHNSSQPQANAASAVNQWARAGFPPQQQVLGMPFYGYVSNSSATRLRSRDAGSFVRAVPDEGGQISFNKLVAQGILVPKYSNAGEVYFVGGHGFSRKWDSCSSTPYAVSAAESQVVTFDDPQSLSMKAKFVKQTGLRGGSVWSIDGDTSDEVLALAIKDGYSS